jgi:hypothetical protein
VKDRTRRFVTPIALSLVVGAGVWAALRFTAPRFRASEATLNLSTPDEGAGFDSERWQQAIEKVKADRAGFGANVALNVPAEVRHYEDRHWFLAAQVAEVKKHNLRTCQDFVDLAAMIKSKDMVAVPAVTNDFVLLGVGAKADDAQFTRYLDDQTVPLYDESQLRDQYARMESKPTKSVNERPASKSKGAPSRNGGKTVSQKPSENGAQPKPLDERSLLVRYYDPPEMRQRMFADYESIRSLAQNFRGRPYDLENPNDRQALKMVMLSSLRPQAFKVLQEIASDYRKQFDRPLPVSSLIRPEQYQHTLRRYNRAATTIDTPPHSTGLAFDIDYRYMSVAEQNFVMAELARLKQAGRVEVLRERNANFHVFAFIDGVRPSDDLIAASREEAGAPPDEAENSNKPEPKPASVRSKAPEKPAKPGKKSPNRARASSPAKRARRAHSFHE